MPSARATVDEYGYAYDHNGNRTYRQNSGPGVSGLNLDEKYAYDNLDRLTAFKRGTLSSGDIADANSTFQHNWTLDSLGNWATFVWDNDGGSGAGAAVTQARSHTAANEISGFTSGPAWQTPGYDAAGNMTNGPQPGSETTNLKFIYDAWNRLVQITDNASTILVTYRYDGLNHRIQKLLGPNPASPDHTFDYYYNENWQVLEERKDTATYAQYVWDPRYIDAPVVRFRDSNTDGTVDDTLYYCQDANMNVTALVNPSGHVVERYVYDSYGKVTFLQGAVDLSGAGTTDWGAGGSASIADNQILFGGYRFDPESGLYHVRNRYYHSTLGRWVSRDPTGYIDAMSLYLAFRGNPCGAIDPWGTQAAATATSPSSDTELKEWDLVGKLSAFFNEYLRRADPRFEKKISDFTGTTIAVPIPSITFSRGSLLSLPIPTPTLSSYDLDLTRVPYLGNVLSMKVGDAIDKLFDFGQSFSAFGGTGTIGLVDKVCKGKFKNEDNPSVAWHLPHEIYIVAVGLELKITPLQSALHNNDTEKEIDVQYEGVLDVDLEILGNKGKIKVPVDLTEKVTIKASGGHAIYSDLPARTLP